MQIAVLADDDQWQELNRGSKDADYYRVNSPGNIPAGVAACLLLQDDIAFDTRKFAMPVLVNSVPVTLTEMGHPANTVRVNGWKGFLSGNNWEMAGDVSDPVLKVFAAMGKKMIPVADEPGLVSARVVAMIINEAFFALQDKISTKEEIDTAMKLGTNYPYGPFEWASLIGVDKIYGLLSKLSSNDSRYMPAALLKEAASS